MIPTPMRNDIPVETALFGTMGYLLGHFAKGDAKLSAAALIIASLANHVFFEIADRWKPSQITLSSEAIYTITHAFVSTIATLTACHFTLISRRVAAAFIFASAAVLLARISILSTNVTEH